MTQTDENVHAVAPDFGQHPYDSQDDAGTYCGIKWQRIRLDDPGQKTADPSGEQDSLQTPNGDKLEIYLNDTPTSSRRDLISRGYNEIIFFDGGDEKCRPTNKLIRERDQTLVVSTIHFIRIDDALKKANANTSIPVKYDFLYKNNRNGHESITFLTASNGYLREESRVIPKDGTSGALEAWEQAAKAHLAQKNDPIYHGYRANEIVHWLIGQMTTSAQKRLYRAIPETTTPFLGYEKHIYTFESYDLTNESIRRADVVISPYNLQIHATICFVEKELVVTTDDKGSTIELQVDVPRAIIDSLKGRKLGEFIKAPWVPDEKIRQVTIKDNLRLRISGAGQPIDRNALAQGNDNEETSLRDRLMTVCNRRPNLHLNENVMPFIESLSEDKLLVFLDEVTRFRKQNEDRIPLNGWGWIGWKIIDHHYDGLCLIGPSQRIGRLVEQQLAAQPSDPTE